MSPPAVHPGGGGAHATLLLVGDVMTGRGLDQILPFPGEARLYEPYMSAATGYIDLAERAHGRIPRGVPFDYVWGDALNEIKRRRPDARIVNLETAITTAATPAPKGINYRMTPGNAGVLTAAGIDCCVLANNHVLDWGTDGLQETLTTLENIRMPYAGAGRTASAAARPAALPLPGGGRLLVFAYGHGSSGIPRHWMATADRPGVNWLPSLSPTSVEQISREIATARRSDDRVAISLHFGPNWGYPVEDEAIAFVHALVDTAGADIVYGHSSHHPKALEVYHGRLVTYGCGDFLNDYEGIGGHEEFRGDLACAYFAELAPDGALAGLSIVAFRIRRFRLERASETDTLWLRDQLNREGQQFATILRLAPDGSLSLDLEHARPFSQT